MPKVTIVEPNNTPEEEEKALRDIADVMERIVREEYGMNVKITLTKVRDKEE